jgi:hypothetical protein
MARRANRDDDATGSGDGERNLRVLVNAASLGVPRNRREWTADLAPVNGPVLGQFPTRSAALAAELDWLRRHWLCPTSAAPD